MKCKFSFAIILFITLASNIFSQKEYIYDPKAVEYFNKGKEFISKSYKQDNRRLEIDYLKQAIQSLDKAIKFDSNFVEAYYLIGRLNDSHFNLDDVNKAKKYYNEVEAFIDNSLIEVCDSISNREILFDIAQFYWLQEENIENNSLKAVQLYNKALEEPLPNVAPPYSRLKDDDIYYAISLTYRQIANYLISVDYGFFEASDYYDKALEYANKLKNYNWLIEEIIKEKKISEKLTFNQDWKAFRNLDYKSVIYREGKPLSTDDNLYLYHPKSMIKEKNNIVRIWIKEIYIGENVEQDFNANGYSKSLYEFDLKNNKYRVLQRTSYYDNKVLGDDNYPKAEWQYITPETIAEEMIENLKIIRK